jgi:phosphomannomutase
MAKKKISLTADMDINFLLEEVELRYKDRKPQTIDGVKIDFDNAWVHLRRSNTEPIIRVYTEAPTQTEADKLGEDMVNLVLKIASANRD